MPDAFGTPKFHHQYTAEIFQRAEDLINVGIWSGLHISRLRRWLANFVSDEERYFAACVLDSLIFRSADQTLALMRQQFQRVLPDVTRLDPTPVGPVDDWEERLRRHLGARDPGIRLIPVIGSDDPPTKSAFLVTRALKRFLEVDERWIIWPNAIPAALQDGVQVLVFLDDFLGTGDQFHQFSQQIALAQYLGRAYCVYAPLVAHTAGVQQLGATTPGLRVAATEVLANDSALFDPSCDAFDDGVNSAAGALEFYLELLRARGIQLTGVQRRGYGGLELAYAFEHAAPDNCLPILWWYRAANWTPLFDR